MVRRGWEERVRADPGWVSGGCRGRGLHGPEPRRQSGGVRSRPGLIVLRSLGKFFGLAGAGRLRARRTDLATAAARPPRTVDPGGTVALGRRARPGGSALAGGRTRPTRKELAHHVDDEEVTSAYSSARMRSAIAAPHATPRRAGSRPRLHLIRFHGVLAPEARPREGPVWRAEDAAPGCVRDHSILGAPSRQRPFMRVPVVKYRRKIILIFYLAIFILMYQDCLRRSCS